MSHLAKAGDRHNRTRPAGGVLQRVDDERQDIPDVALQRGARHTGKVAQRGQHRRRDAALAARLALGLARPGAVLRHADCVFLRTGRRRLSRGA